MANFFDGILKAVTHPFDEAKFMLKNSGKVTEDLFKGNFSKAFKDVKAIPGNHQEMMNDVTVPILGNNKVSKNSDAIAGTIIGGIFAAPAIGGAMGGASGGASGGAAGGSGGSISSIGTQGLTNAAPSTSTAAPTTTSWMDTLMSNISDMTDSMDATTPEGKKEQEAFETSFSRSLEMQRQLAVTPASQRGKLLAQRNAEELTKVFTDKFGKDF